MIDILISIELKEIMEKNTGCTQGVRLDIINCVRRYLYPLHNDYMGTGTLIAH